MGLWLFFALFGYLMVVVLILIVDGGELDSAPDFWHDYNRRPDRYKDDWHG